MIHAPLLVHSGHEVSGLWAGLTHPWFGLDHLLAMVLVGLLAARVSTPRLRWVPPVGFVVMMAAGAGIGFVAPMHAAIEWVISASVIVIGLMLALTARVKLAWAAPVVAAAGVFHGYAHASEASGQAAMYVLGFLASTAALHALGLGAGWLVMQWREAPVRWAGGLTAAGFLGLLLIGP